MNPMKKLPLEERRATISVPMTTKRDFQKMCLDLDVRQSAVITQLISAWIEKQKKKESQREPLIANG
jgi:hypothetical protein